MLQSDKKPKGRTHVDNGGLWNRATVDGRTRTAKLIASNTEGYTASMHRKPTDFERQLLRTAACEAVLIEAFEQVYADRGVMHEGYAVLVRDHAEKLIL